ncbi:MAG: ribosomal protein S18-alanine N-acetyltransferase [Desulfobulbaceae bacterium]|nr:ribosomal protein S18-alanine N-acetyltransferase [Desulfobulbaceae bacterium]
MSVTILPAVPSDLADIWAIEQTLTGPWTYGQLEGELTISHGWQFVAKGSDGKVCGYLFGITVIDEAEIRKVAVASAWRRQGVASLLLTAACQRLSLQKISSCFLELRLSNIPALKLYQKNTFQVVGQRKSYYTLPTEDAMILKKSFK